MRTTAQAAPVCWSRHIVDNILSARPSYALAHHFILCPSGCVVSCCCGKTALRSLLLSVEKSASHYSNAQMFWCGHHNAISLTHTTQIMMIWIFFSIISSGSIKLVLPLFPSCSSLDDSSMDSDGSEYDTSLSSDESDDSFLHLWLVTMRWSECCCQIEWENYALTLCLEMQFDSKYRILTILLRN